MDIPAADSRLLTRSDIALTAERAFPASSVAPGDRLDGVAVNLGDGRTLWHVALDPSATPDQVRLQTLPSGRRLVAIGQHSSLLNEDDGRTLWNSADLGYGLGDTAVSDASDKAQGTDLRDGHVLWPTDGLRIERHYTWAERPGGEDNDRRPPGPFWASATTFCIGSIRAPGRKHGSASRPCPAFGYAENLICVRQDLSVLDVFDRATGSRRIRLRDVPFDSTGYGRPAYFDGLRFVARPAHFIGA